jgi:hypothetical protein
MQSIWRECSNFARRVLAGMLCGMLGLGVLGFFLLVASCMVQGEPLYWPGVVYCLIVAGILGSIGGGLGATVPRTPGTRFGGRILLGSIFSAGAVAFLVSVTIMKVADPSGYGLVLVVAAAFGSIPGALGAIGTERLRNK